MPYCERPPGRVLACQLASMADLSHPPVEFTDLPERGRIAVKIVTATGMEMTAVRTLGELQP